MAKKIEERFLDKRVATRYVQEGAISQSEWDSHLKDLPDDAERSEPIEFHEGPKSGSHSEQIETGDGEEATSDAEATPSDANGSEPVGGLS